ncbi:hypothetical protein LCGC14_0339350 [marine sediment metagenome]|uniref:Uncharacterized protein n=1 Tax=marine sediment metagenome TaxID=412755 RepID=A0A0F9W1C7_9ZZZZ
MPIDDDRQLAEEVEAALKALGIARQGSRSTGPVQRYVMELSGTEWTEAAPTDAKTSRSKTDSSMPAAHDQVGSSRRLLPADPRALPPSPE